MAIPAWARHLLDEADLEKISDAVERTEQTTSGEIVPMIVRQSSASGHVQWLTTLLSAGLSVMTLYAVLYFWLPGFVLSPGPAAGIGFGLSLFSILIGAFLAKKGVVRRILTPIPDQVLQVRRRAELEFYYHQFDHTQGRTGVLIFVSLMEKTATVLADQKISEKLPQDTWDKLVKRLIEKFHAGRAAEGMVEAIEECGKLLQPHFPVHPHDTNEIKNHLHIVE